MKMTVDKFNERVRDFVWQVVIPEARDVRTKCAFGAIEKMGLLRVGEGNLETMRGLGIVDADGNVDVDRLKAGVDGALDAGGGVISTGGLLHVNVPRPVTDKLFRFLETGTVE